MHVLQPKYKMVTKRSSLMCKGVKCSTVFFRSVPFLHSVLIFFLLIQMYVTKSCLGFFDPNVEKNYIRTFHPQSDESNLFVFPGDVGLGPLHALCYNLIPVI